jgi:hypothetical protein
MLFNCKMARKLLITPPNMRGISARTIRIFFFQSFDCKRHNAMAAIKQAANAIKQLTKAIIHVTIVISIIFQSFPCHVPLIFQYEEIVPTFLVGFSLMSDPISLKNHVVIHNDPLISTTTINILNITCTHACETCRYATNSRKWHCTKNR